ncbi:PP2C family protein-serine/threonine phosphatase [Tomitella fengzijianii]|uniref:Serine/threonine protein phosphatase PstP n=1 Tax=Tomitella fengzijianii TaxID=2597660 RepID=A0A516WZ37_9ACTN|nr:PP2C family serine/threonine-protein phosphatase [Tomitella fengzijianii]QDQ96104.1 serine/threonine-protein phosphatase [Tomitella fengzijianii]
MTLVLKYAARSDRGLVRGNNEDSVYAGARLLALADGMGGHAAGEVASQLIIAALAPLDDDDPGGDLLGKLEAATRAGNEAIADHVEEEPELEGMGTTLTAILFAGSRLGLVHIGDSRGYLLRDDQLTQITRDDTFVQSLVDQGRITAEQAKTHPQRSMIMRALTGNDIEPTLTMRESRAGDRYLLCSDGLSDVVSTETIADTMREGDHRECADRLIELALRSGGPDNITVVVADVIDLDYGQSRPIVAGAASDEEDEAPPPDTSAGRAAAMRPPAAKPRRVLATQPPPAAKRRWGRIGFVAALLIVLAGIAVTVAVMWIRSSYYVGESDGLVAVHRGMPGSVLGISMQSVQQVGCVDGEGTLQLVAPDADPADCDLLTIDDLQPAAREQVRSGLPGGSLENAQQQIGQLARTELLPVCRPAAPAPEPGTAPGAPPPAAPTAPAEPTPAPTPSDAAPTGASEFAPGQIPGQNCRVGA